MDNPAIYIPTIGVAVVAIYLLSCIRILNEYERGVRVPARPRAAENQRARADYGLLAGRPNGACQHANLRR